ncbi:MAG: ABC transporter permease [Candidatus Methanomethylophilaceae archaeon]|nr:ABC transporter permease [Candidatus Methanomethylophilaceae archaeon]
MFETVKELFAYKSMLRSLVRREVRGRYKGSLLGFLWNFITPLMQIVVYVMVFSMIFRIDIDNYAIYIIVGMVPWIFLSESLVSGSGTIVENSQMVTKIYFPRAVLPISNVLSKLVNYLISLVIVFIIIICSQYPLDPVVLLMLPVVMVLFFFAVIGATMLLAAINTYYRDVQYITNVIMMVLIWLSPIMYMRSMSDNAIMSFILDINPVTYYIEAFQSIFYWGEFPDPMTMLVCTLFTVFILVVGWVVFYRLEKDFAEVL